MTREEVIRRRKERKRKEKQRKRRIWIIRNVIYLVVIVCIGFSLGKCASSITKHFSSDKDDKETKNSKAAASIEDGGDEDSISDDYSDIQITDEISEGLYDYIGEYPKIATILRNRSDYPDDLLNIFFHNPETLDFIVDYPAKHGKVQEINITSLPEDNSVPHYLQWDERWGYCEYGNNIIAISGCGPTSLSMVASYLLGDVSLNPYAVATFSQESGYCTSVGTDWKLMSEGAAALGLESDNISLSEKSVSNALQAGKPVICSMGPGDFTNEGHFIVMTSYEDGYVKVNDPNSIKNSEKKWKFADIKDQIKNLWAFSKKA